MKYIHRLKKLSAELDIYGGFFDVAQKKTSIEALEAKMAEPTFWSDPKGAQKIIGECNLLRNAIKPMMDFKNQVEDLQILAELVEESSENEVEAEIQELGQTATELLERMDSLEIQSFLSGPHDKCSAILSIHAGAGGTESCDWADILLRLYTRWAERRGFQIEVQDIQPGEEAGISSASLRLIGPFAYGYAKAERGVHRLVRISPFDSNKRRHTSFCSVDVIAEIEDEELNIEIKDEDLRVDTYRSSGAGGQHVNKTESAIRLTHLPTGIVVTCQNDRSQHKNRASAMKTLKARIYEKKQDDKRSEMEKFYGTKGEIGWGNQIRSYVFQPYQMVKDLRTGAETGNIQEVMDGDIDRFINAWLRAGCPKSRNKDLKFDD